MTELTDTLAPVKSITLQGKPYKVGEIDVGDLADFEQWATEIITARRFSKIELAKKVYETDDIPVSIREEALRDPTKEEIEEEGKSIKGATFLLHRALRKGNPEITVEMAGALVNISDLDRMLDVIGMSDKKKAEKKPKSIKGLRR